MTSSLLIATLDLLGQTAKDSWPKLAKEIGCTYTWLAQLDSGMIKEPGVNKIERLYIALGGELGKL